MLQTNCLRFILCITGSLFSGIAFAQSVYIPLNEDYYHLIDRYEVKSGQLLPHLFTTIKPYKRSAVIDWADSVSRLDGFTSSADQFNYTYLQNDSWEWSGAESATSKKPILKHFYQKKADFFHVDIPEFDLHVNPVLYLGAGQDSRRDDMLFINTRGLEVRGMVDKKVGFYTYLSENQALLPSYVRDQMVLNPVIPHEGFWKSYKQGNAVDFFQARGYITFDATKHIHVQFGHDRFFIGNGQRSFIFSDYAPPSMFLMSNVKVWKLNYMFLLTKMTANADATLGGSRDTGNGYPDKFVALHHFSINLGKKLNIGLFESVVFSPDDTTGLQSFRFDYLNPIIFYRAIEQQNGSTDNVLLGMDFKWNVARKLSFYGQFVLDEFVMANIRARNGWWANKFAIQAGGKYVDAFGIRNLDLQGEINVARPYTFTHNTRYGSYSHYRQPIGHPLGANFTELIGVIRYQPLPRLQLTAKLMVATIGRDSAELYTWGDNKLNWGSDILKDSRTREQGFDNRIGQGFSNEIAFLQASATWQWKHNFFIDANFQYRMSKSELTFYNTNTLISSVALRWNIPKRSYHF